MGLTIGREVLLSFAKEDSFKQRPAAGGKQFTRQRFRRGQLTQWGGQVTQAEADFQSDDRLSHNGIIIARSAGVAFGCDLTRQTIENQWAQFNYAKPVGVGDSEFVITAHNSGSAGAGQFTTELPTGVTTSLRLETAVMFRVISPGQPTDGQVFTVSSQTDIGTSATTLAVEENIPGNAYSGQTFRGRIVGIKVGRAGPGPSRLAGWSYSNGVGSIGTSIWQAADFISAGLRVGMRVQFGSRSAAKTNRNMVDSSNRSVGVGYGTVSSIGNTSITFRDLTDNLKVNSNVFVATSEIRFSTMIRQYRQNEPEYAADSYVWEAEFPGLAATGNVPDRTMRGYEYVGGAYANAAQLQFPQNNKCGATFSYTGAYEDTNLLAGTKYSMTAYNEPEFNNLINTSSSYAELSLTKMDGTTLRSRMVNWNLNAANNVEAQYFQGSDEADIVIPGNQNFSLDGAMTYEDATFKELVANSEEVVIKAGFVNPDFVCIFHQPSVEFTNNQLDISSTVVNVGLAGRAHADNEDYGISTSLITSIIEYHS